MTIAAGTEGMAVELGPGSLFEAAVLVAGLLREAAVVVVVAVVPGLSHEFEVLVVYTEFLVAKLGCAEERMGLVGSEHSGHVACQERQVQSAAEVAAAALEADSGQDFWQESGGAEQGPNVDWGCQRCHHVACAQELMMVQWPLRFFENGQDLQVLWVLTGASKAPSEFQQGLACLLEFEWICEPDRQATNICDLHQHPERG